MLRPVCSTSRVSWFPIVAAWIPNPAQQTLPYNRSSPVANAGRTPKLIGESTTIGAVHHSRAFELTSAIAAPGKRRTEVHIDALDADRVESSVLLQILPDEYRPAPALSEIGNVEPLRFR